MNVFWSDWDMANGFKVECEVKDEVPAPGLKRGMSIWSHTKQADFYKTYKTIHNAPDDYTIGWLYVWNVNSNWFAFKVD